ncbi:MAG: 1-deoxy-D-xylulose-5-phosphate synthase [Planctomycetales bacterium]
MTEQLPKDICRLRSQIMYLEDKSRGLEGPARIGRVHLSKSGKTLYYRGRRFRSLKGVGFKSNYFDVDSGDKFWISRPRKDQNDRLYGGNRDVAIDDDALQEYRKYLRS